MDRSRRFAIMRWLTQRPGEDFDAYEERLRHAVYRLLGIIAFHVAIYVLLGRYS